MSVSPSDINRSASQIYSMTEEVRQESKKIINEITESDRYWSGTAADALQQSSQSLQNDLSKQLKHLERLVEVMKQLSSAVRRADEERAEQKRKEALALAAAAAAAANAQRKK